MTQISSQLNHILTRADVIETSGRAPIRKYALPIGSVILAGAILKNDLHHTDPEHKSKALKRDAFTMLGVTLGLLGSMRFNRSKPFVYTTYKLSQAAKKSFDPSHLNLSDKTIAAIKRTQWGKDLHFDHHGHHHSHTDGNGFKTEFGNRLSQLFKHNQHDHGIVGGLTLETLAGGTIAGGVLGGAIADKWNGEKLKHTMPAKLYESIYQFMGNITLCTIAIISGAWLSKGLSKQALKHAGIDAMTQNSLLKHLKKIGTEQSTDLRRIPTDFTRQLSEAWEALRPDPKNAERQHRFIHDLMHWHSDYYPSKTPTALLQKQKFKQILTQQLKKDPNDIAALRKASYDHLSERFHKELQQVQSLDKLADTQNSKLKEDLVRLAHHRFHKSNERYGIIGGVIAGVIGGSWASDHINKLLSKYLHLEKPSYKATLFHSNKHQSGLMKDKVGERGIHWWDMILHADDWPSALYMAGVDALEPIIRVLYGMSGYLSGIAGTVYSHAPKTPPAPPNPFIANSPQA